MFWNDEGHPDRIRSFVHPATTPMLKTSSSFQADSALSCANLCAASPTVATFHNTSVWEFDTVVSALPFRTESTKTVSPSRVWSFVCGFESHVSPTFSALGTGRCQRGHCNVTRYQHAQPATFQRKSEPHFHYAAKLP